MAQYFKLPEGPEKQRVVNAFMSSLNNNVRVVSVERVQNVSMWQSFAVKRSMVFAREQDPILAARRFERHLFHGTNVSQCRN